MTSSRMFLIVIVSVIFSLGLIMIFSTTSAEILDHELEKSTHQAIFKQIYYAIGGLFLGWIVIKVGYHQLLNYSTALLIFFTFLLLLTLIPGIGKEVNGSRRWLSLAGFTFQPSEFVKYIIPAFFIHKFLNFAEKKFGFSDFIKLIGIIAIPIFFILIEPNNGTTIAIGITLGALFLLINIPYRYWAWPLLGFVMIGGAFASHLPYVSARIKVYLHPELDLKGKGHQPYQAKIATGSGKLWGKGPGNSLQKLSYLPEAQNDYIAAIYAEEFGFVGVLGILTLYLLMASCGFAIAYHCQDRGGYLLASCAIFLISLQAFLNFGVVSGLLPSTGLNLPLFSQGGSSLIANIMGISILFSVSFESDKMSKNYE